MMQSYTCLYHDPSQILQDVGERSKAAINIGKDLGEWFTTKVGMRQGDPISPNTFG